MAPSKTPKLETRRGSGRLQFLTQEELKRLFAVIKEKRDKSLFLLAYRHGLRASEIGFLQRTDVDLKQGRITGRCEFTPGDGRQRPHLPP
jgi:integrase